MVKSTASCESTNLEGDAPKVSVIIPAYNTARYIAETLDSVFTQTFTDFEVVVVNDGSPDTDKLEQVLQPYRERIVYLMQENRGPSATRNTGIRHARGEYLAFLDSDDCWLPEYLATQMKRIEQTPSLDMVYCDCLIFGDSPSAGKSFMEVVRPTGAPTLENLLFNETSIQPSCVVVRKRIVMEAGLFDERLRRNEDFDLWLRLAYRGAEIARQDHVLSRYRKHSESLSWDESKLFEAKIDVLKRFEESTQLPGETRTRLRDLVARGEADLELQHGKLCLFAGKFAEAVASLNRANALVPSKKLQVALFGLRTAPRFTAFAAMAWERYLVGMKPVSAVER